MPKLTEDEIIKLIDTGRLKALSPDTNVFHRPDYNLQSATLRRLAIFHARGIEVIFPEMIASEIRSHMASQLRDTDAALNKVLDEYAKKWRLDPNVQSGAKTSCGLGRDPVATAITHWKDFLGQIRGTEFPADGLISVSEMTQMYFEVAPPFESKPDKKSEFPDAIALLSLEGWARKNNGFVLAISQDKGWAAYGETSDGVIVLPDVHQAYAIVNRSAEAIAMAIVNSLGQKTAPNLDRAITSAIQRRLDDFDFEVDAESYLSIEARPEGAYVGDVSYLTNPSVLEIEDEQITFAILASAAVEVRAEFDLAVRDDGEDHVIDTADKVIERTVEFEVAITVPKVEAADPEILNLEVTRSPLRFHFGYLEPFAREMREMAEREPDQD